MQIKIYQYNSPIQFETVNLHLNHFKNEIIQDVKYIEIHIQLIHSNGTTEVDLCKAIQINIRSKMVVFISQLKPNVKKIKSHFKEDLFSEIIFQYKEISYSEYIHLNKIHNKNVLPLEGMIRLRSRRSIFQQYYFLWSSLMIFIIIIVIISLIYFF